MQRDTKDTSLGQELEHQIRAKWLVFLSVTLAILIELFPTEIDLMYGPALGMGEALFGPVPSAGSILILLAIKAACLALILLPIFILR